MKNAYEIKESSKASSSKFYITLKPLLPENRVSQPYTL